MVVIGIDPGAKGGIAITRDGQVIHADLMPLAGKEVDGAAITALLKPLEGEVFVYIEKVWAMARTREGKKVTQGASSSFSFGKGFGIVLGVVMALGFHLEQVTPQRWKGVVLAGTAKDKDAAIAYCRQRWPNVSLIPKGKRTPKDGIADALCIMEFGRRIVGGNHE